ncbi:MAG: sulfatase [Bacteroidota bacterium]
MQNLKSILKLGGSGILGISLLTGTITSCTPDKEEEKQPNILFIIADDYGYHDLSITGSEYYETPNIDRLAGESTIFTQGYTASQVCSPARASIMSGKFTPRHGITDWIGAPEGESWRNMDRHTKLLPPEYNHQLPQAYTTWPEAMKEAEYKTFFAGKWHLGGEGSWPEDHGFDINKGGWDKGSPIGGFFSPWENPNLENHYDGESLTMRLARETAQFLKNNNPKETGQPVFAALSFYAVHAPLQTTQEKWGKYRDKADEMGITPKGEGFEMGHFLPIRQVQDNPVYAGMVETMDQSVGLVMNALEEAEISDNTVVVFTSDHGGVCSGDAYATTNAPLRGGKGYQFEGGLRVPYFVKVPGLTSGDSCDVPVFGTDFYPTALDLAGKELKPEEHNDGVSIVPLLQGQDIEERDLIWHYPHYGNQGGRPSSIIRRGEWKLIHYYEESSQALYNVTNDPYEQNNLATERPEKTLKLASALKKKLKEMGARYPYKDPQYDPEKEKQHLKEVEKELMPWLEQQRLQFLSRDYEPGNNWWGSEATDQH